MNTSPAQVSKNRWFSIGLPLALILLAPLVLPALLRTLRKLPGMPRAETVVSTTSAAPAPLPVETLVLEPVISVRRKRHFTGEVKPSRRAEIGFPLGGRLTSVLVREGDTVAAGERLALLDTRSLLARRAELDAGRDAAAAHLAELRAGPRKESIQAARENVRAVETELELAELISGRREELSAKDAIAREVLDQALANTATLSAQLAASSSILAELEAGTRPEQISAQVAAVAQLDAAIDLLEVDIEDSELRAPFAAVVSRRHAHEGAVLQSGSPVLQLVEKAHREVWIGVSKEAFEELAIGSYHELALGSELVKAELRAQLPDVDRINRTHRVVFALPPELNPPAGALVRLQVDEQRALSGFWLPVEALVKSERGLWSCFVVESQGQPPVQRLVRAEVEVLLTEASRTLVRGTLSSGDQVVASGLQRVVVGQAVEPTARSIVDPTTSPATPSASER